MGDSPEAVPQELAAPVAVPVEAPPEVAAVDREWALRAVVLLRGRVGQARALAQRAPHRRRPVRLYHLGRRRVFLNRESAREPFEA